MGATVKKCREKVNLFSEYEAFADTCTARSYLTLQAEGILRFNSSAIATTGTAASSSYIGGRGNENTSVTTLRQYFAVCWSGNANDNLEYELVHVAHIPSLELFLQTLKEHSPKSLVNRIHSLLKTLQWLEAKSVSMERLDWIPRIHSASAFLRMRLPPLLAAARRQGMGMSLEDATARRKFISLETYRGLCETVISRLEEYFLILRSWKQNPSESFSNIGDAAYNYEVLLLIGSFLFVMPQRREVYENLLCRHVRLEDSTSNAVSFTVITEKNSGQGVYASTDVERVVIVPSPINKYWMFYALFVRVEGFLSQEGEYRYAER